MRVYLRAAVAVGIACSILSGCIKRNVVNPNIPPTTGPGTPCGDGTTLTDCLIRALQDVRTARAELTRLAAQASPVGTIIAWSGPGATIPVGWKVCNGAPIDVATHAALFKVLQYRYGGAGNHFRLPDYRGWFLRGVDDGAGRDPEAAVRVAIPGSGSPIKGDVVGTFQKDQLANHKHEFGGNDYPPGGTSRGIFQDVTHPNPTRSFETEKDGGGPETRPSNVSVYWIIRSDDY